MAEQKEFPSDKADKFVVRFPDGMRDKIAEVAKASGRSMNAEIVARLEQSFEDRPAQTSSSVYALSAIERLEALLVTAEGNKDLSDQQALMIASAFMEAYPFVRAVMERDEKIKDQLESTIDLGIKSVRNLITAYKPQGMAAMMKAVTRTQEILAPAFAHLSTEDRGQAAIEISPEHSERVRAAQETSVSRIKQILEHFEVIADK